jgi:hypothetical protein
VVEPYAFMVWCQLNKPRDSITGQNWKLYWKQTPEWGRGSTVFVAAHMFCMEGVEENIWT